MYVARLGVKKSDYGKCTKNFEYKLHAKKTLTNSADPEQTATSEAV